MAKNWSDVKALKNNTAMHASGRSSATAHPKSQSMDRSRSFVRRSEDTQKPSRDRKKSFIAGLRSSKSTIGETGRRSITNIRNSVDRIRKDWDLFFREQLPRNETRQQKGHDQIR